MSLIRSFVRYVGHLEEGTRLYTKRQGKKAQGINGGMCIPVFNVVDLCFAYSAFISKLPDR